MLWPAPVPSRAPPRSLTMTLAPSRASVRAYSRPSPPPAPVTTMTRSCTPGMKKFLFSRCSLTSGRCSSEELASQVPRLLCIRRVQHGTQIGSGRLGQHRLAVAELLEAELAVIGAH